MIEYTWGSVSESDTELRNLVMFHLLNYPRPTERIEVYERKTL